jgi:hypothetical protein
VEPSIRSLVAHLRAPKRSATSFEDRDTSTSPETRPRMQEKNLSVSWPHLGERSSQFVSTSLAVDTFDQLTRIVKEGVGPRARVRADHALLVSPMVTNEVRRDSVQPWSRWARRLEEVPARIRGRERSRREIFCSRGTHAPV